MDLNSFDVMTPGGPAALRYADLPGDHLPIVFLHGLGGASTLEYARTAAYPGLSHHRRLLVDLLGNGASDHSEDFAYTIEAHARCVDALVRSLALERIILFGHSMGGAVACSLAALCPGRVAAVVLTESNLDAGGGFASRAIAASTEADFVAGGFAAMLAEIQADNNPWARTFALAWPAALHRQSVSGIAGVTPSWRDILYGLDVPRCYVFGADTLPDPDADELPRHGVAAPVLPDCGHNMAWQNPDALARAVAAFLHDAAE
ncbi:MAG: alpha/beta hydrolase [Actinomycetia bacterium]|nr:alpha/beta hydrolase [Actinomycetes bacterium]